MSRPTHITERLEYLRGELRAERISYGELAELESLKEHIEPGDVELLEAAGVPENADKLRQLAQELFDAGFVTFDDIVTLCACVSRKFGDELTLNEGQFVADRLEELWENKPK